MPATQSPRITLDNGIEIPQLGLGVYQSGAGGETERAVRWALDLGYRHVDTARIYGNEEDVGKAIRASDVPREEIFVTTKLWNSDHGEQQAVRACEGSLKRLGLDHVDLYLVHWPVAKVRRASWKGLTQLLESGKCRAIGVSNYTIRHLDEMAADGGVVPAVNQVELHPFLTQEALVARCREAGIVVEAYSPLARGKRMKHPTLARVAERAGKTPAQVLVRWSIQRGYVVIPKSVKRERIEENARVFDFVLPDDDMQRLDACNEDLRTSWDPTDAP
jgi:diketogulonate reductase-like aldo/keto reductase